MHPKPHKSSLKIRLAESVVFLRGSAESTIFGRRVTREAQPAMLRGLLVLELDKPTKISSIELAFEGKIQSTWPEGKSLLIRDDYNLIHVFKALGRGKSMSWRSSKSSRRRLCISVPVKPTRAASDAQRQSDQVFTVITKTLKRITTTLAKCNRQAR